MNEYRRNVSNQTGELLVTEKTTIQSLNRILLPRCALFTSISTLTSVFVYTVHRINHQSMKLVKHDINSDVKLENITVCKMNLFHIVLIELIDRHKNLYTTSKSFRSDI